MKGKVANRRFDGRVSLLLGEKVARDSETNEVEIFIHGLNLIFSNGKVGLQETFLSKKFPAPSKISLRPHIPCASGNKPCKVFGNGYRTYDY